MAKLSRVRFSVVSLQSLDISNTIIVDKKQNIQ